MPAACLKRFSLSNDEWMQLHKQFHKLSCFQARSLVDRNNMGSHTDDYEDIEQEMRQHVVIAAMYHKRQCFIDDSFKVLKGYVKNKKDTREFLQLEMLWVKKRTEDGVKQKFGREQEARLQKMIDELVPEGERPDPSNPLRFTEQFITYCKQITWNRIRTLGRNISKQKPIRSGLVSISSYNYLASNGYVE